MPFDPSSWDLGPAHIISFSTEVYFFLNYGRHLVERQFHWLESDLQVTWLEVPSHPLTSLPSPPLSLPLTLGPSLQKANKNRAARPWIITMGHRPMYCSNADLDDCTWHESKVGTPSPGWGAERHVGGRPDSPLTSSVALPRFAKASLASCMGWRTFSTNTVSDPGEFPAP